MTIPEFLSDKNIVILGFGKQGKATFNYIRKHFKEKIITISDKNTDIDRTELDENVEFKLGEKYLEGIEKFDLIIKSPGVVLKDVDTSSFENKIITDYELLLKYTPGFKIGITGTKGKSTTSTVLYNVLKEQGKDVFLVGNIGNPIFNEVDNIKKDSYVVIEVSSHTLEFAKYAPQISILLNIFQEHLDHVNCIEDYIKAKFNVAKNQSENDFFIYNAENELMNSYKYNYKENDVAVYLNSYENNNQIKNKVYLKDGSIYFNNKCLMRADEPRNIEWNMLEKLMILSFIMMQLLQFQKQQ